MEIVTTIPGISFAGNFPDVEVTAEEDVNFQLYIGDLLYELTISDIPGAFSGFSVGQTIIGQTSGATGNVVSYSAPYLKVNMTAGAFQFGEDIQAQVSESMEDAGTIHFLELSGAGDPILEETYSPNSEDDVLVELREFFEAMLEVNIPPSDQGVYEQETGYRKVAMIFEKATQEFTFDYSNVIGAPSVGLEVSAPSGATGIITEIPLGGTSDVVIQQSAGSIRFKVGDTISGTDDAFPDWSGQITAISPGADNQSGHEILVIKGGIQALNTPDDEFIDANFLTWQERTKKVKENDPEWLSYFPNQTVTVKVRGYFEDETTQTVAIQSLTANKLYSFNCNWTVLRNNLAAVPYQMDVWVEKAGVVLSNVQRYVLTDEHFDNDDIFLFANSMGGVDTIRFTGANERIEEFAVETSFFEREEREVDVEPQRVFVKNTGDFRSRRHLLWARDFFASAHKYYWQFGLLIRVITEGRDLSSRVYSLNSYGFRFRESEQLPYQNYLEMNHEEIELGEEVLYVKVPEGDFVLTPEGHKLEFY